MCVITAALAPVVNEEEAQPGNFVSHRVVVAQRDPAAAALKPIIQVPADSEATRIPSATITCAPSTLSSGRVRTLATMVERIPEETPSAVAAQQQQQPGSGVVDPSNELLLSQSEYSIVGRIERCAHCVHTEIQHNNMKCNSRPLPESMKTEKQMYIHWGPSGDARLAMLFSSNKKPH